MIRTGGGQFDPNERHLYFIAGDPQQAHRRYHLVAVNDAMSDHEAVACIDEPLARGSKLFLDSGIFNLTNNHKRATGCTMDQALALAPEEIEGFDKLFDRYVELVRRYEHQLWGYIELDQGGRDNKRRTRQRLHDLGLNPIPVYHPLNDGWDYFDELASNYDRICFGNIVQAHRPLRTRLLYTLWERRRRYPHLWVHVLGLTADTLALSMPPDSCDSSSWTAALRWGHATLVNSYMQRAIGTVGQLPRGFVYNRDVERHAPGGYQRTADLYANEYDLLTDTWQNLTSARSDLGFHPWPQPLPAEGEPCPAV